MTAQHATDTDFLELLDVDDARAATDERMESIAFECLANGLSDGRVLSILNILGFSGDFPCFAIAGRAAATPTASRARIRQTVRDLGARACITGVWGEVTAAVILPEAAATREVTCTAVSAAFSTAAAPVCLGSLRHGVEGASRTLRGALSTLRAAAALASLPQVLRAEDMLPERALLGDEDARWELVDVVYGSLSEAGPDDPTMDTVSTFLFSGGSLETTAKALNVHPNTVRYRLKRAADTTGWDATDPREAYVLRTAIALGRMHARD